MNDEDNKIKEVRIRVTCGKCGYDTWFFKDAYFSPVSSAGEKSKCFKCGNSLEYFAALRKRKGTPKRLYG